MNYEQEALNPFKTVLPIPSEAQEQAAVIKWWRYVYNLYGVPEDTLIHIANEGSGSVSRGKLLKKLGVRPGVADLFLSVARGNYHGLWIEMKRLGGRLRPEQRAFLENMQGQGYDTAVCHGAEAARLKIAAYLTQKEENV